MKQSILLSLFLSCVTGYALQASGEKRRTGRSDATDTAGEKRGGKRSRSKPPLVAAPAGAGAGAGAGSESVPNQTHAASELDEKRIISLSVNESDLTSDTVVKEAFCHENIFLLIKISDELFFRLRDATNLSEEERSCCISDIKKLHLHSVGVLRSLTDEDAERSQKETVTALYNIANSMLDREHFNVKEGLKGYIKRAIEICTLALSKNDVISYSYHQSFDVYNVYTGYFS